MLWTGVLEDSRIQPDLGCQHEQLCNTGKYFWTICIYVIWYPSDYWLLKSNAQNKNRAQGNWKRNLTLNIPSCFYFLS